MDSRHSFIVFYIAFISLLLAVTATMPLTIISGIKQADIDTLLIPQDAPENPGILDGIIWQISAGFSWVRSFFMLMGASSSYQLVAVILTPLTIGFILSIYSIIRNG